MNVDKYIKKQLTIYSSMLALGLVALLVGLGFDYETHTMTGVAIGFIPAGLGCLLVTLYARKNPAMYRNIESEADERSVFIRNKSGATAFWITFWFVFALTMMANIINISQISIGVYTLVFMSVLYFVIFFINFRRY
ncbi:MAG: hypothetical protein ABFD18_15450 [Syntrophomonas sp.]